MSAKEKTTHIFVELKGHAPYTLLGVMLGIIFMLMFKNVSRAAGHTLFAVFHPAHVVLSAMVTASMFRIHALSKRFLLVLIVGYFGSVGVATLSDVVIPHLGINLLGLDIPTHAETHPHTPASPEAQIAAGEQQQHENHIHLGFIEEWYIVNPAALLGVLIAFFLPRTKFPHTGHVLISTWASSSYLLMNLVSEITAVTVVGVFVTLFIATWLPCCISDIVFPLLFTRKRLPPPEHATYNQHCLDE